MNKTTISGVTISVVKRTHAWWMYLWPLLSRRALLQTLAVLAVVLPIMGWTIYRVDPAGVMPVLIGGIIGAFLCRGYPVLPARLTLATRSEARHFVTDLQARLINFGYAASDQPPVPSRYHYWNARPFWRWKEHDVELLVHEHELVLNGPVVILHLLRARLLLPDDRAYLKA